MSSGEQVNIDLKSNKTEEKSYKDIEKLFQILSNKEKELGEDGIIDLNGDGFQNKEDYKTFLEGDISFGKNLGIIELEIKAFEKKGEISNLKKLIDLIEKRKKFITKTDSYLNGSKIVEDQEFTNIKEINIEEDSKKYKKVDLSLDKKVVTHQEQKINRFNVNNVNNISQRIENSNSYITKKQEKLGDLYNDLDEQNILIETYLNYLKNNKESIVKKDYEVIFEQIEKEVKKTTEIIENINNEIKEIDDKFKEKEKLKKDYNKKLQITQEYIQKILKKLNTNIEKKDINESLIGKINIFTKNITTFFSEKTHKSTKYIEETAKKVKAGALEFFKSYDTIQQIYNENGLKGNSAAEKILSNAEKLKNKDGSIDNKNNKKLRELAKAMGKLAKDTLINKAYKYQIKIETIVGKEHPELNNIINEIKKYGDKIENFNQINPEELKGLNQMVKQLEKIKLKTDKINKIINSSLLSGKKLENLKEEIYIFHVELKDWDLEYNEEEIKNLVEERKDKDLINKDINEMSIVELKTILKALQENYHTYSSGIWNSKEIKLSDIDNKGEANMFQEKIIKTIFEKNGGKKDKEVGFDELGNLWGFNNEKGNYIVDISDFINELQNKDIENINSKTLASYFSYLKENNTLDIQTLISTMGLEKIKQLQKIWNNQKYTITKTILENTNLNEIIQLIENFNPKEYEDKLSKPESIEEGIKQINIAIEKENTPEQKLLIQQTALKQLNIEFDKSFYTTDKTKSKYNDLNKLLNIPGINKETRKIIQETIINPLVEKREKEKIKASKDIKQQMIKKFEKQFKGSSDILKTIKAIINNNDLQKENENLLSHNAKILEEKIKKFNKEHPNEKIQINTKVINLILKNVITLRTIELQGKYDEFIEKYQEILEKIKNIDEKIKKVKQEKIKITDDIKTNEKYVEQLEEAKKDISFEDKKEYDETIEKLKNKNKELKIEQEKKALEEKELEEKNKELKIELEKTNKTGEKIAKQKVDNKANKTIVEKAIKTGKNIRDVENSNFGKKVREEAKQEKKKIEVKFDKLLNGTEKEKQTIFNELKEENDKYYSSGEYLKDFKKLEESINGIENNLDIENKDNNTISETHNYSFSPETGIITTSENGVENSFELSKQDKELVSEKPELLEKIVDFHKTLSELGLNNLWDIKDKIFKSLQNKYGVGFELKGDYLNKNETFIFLNSILKSVGEEEIGINTSTVDGFENKFKQKNYLQFNGGMKDNILKKGESSIEERFLEKYVNKFSTFQIGEFTESLTQKNSN